MKFDRNADTADSKKFFFTVILIRLQILIRIAMVK